MQYLLLIYENEKRFATGYDPAEMKEYMAFGETYGKAIKGGNALQATTTATTVRVRDGKRLTTDGPSAETKEQLGGYYLVEANNLDDAIEIAGKIPGARTGCVEVRPIETFSGLNSKTSFAWSGGESYPPSFLCWATSIFRRRLSRKPSPAP